MLKTIRRAAGAVAILSMSALVWAGCRTDPAGAQSDQAPVAQSDIVSFNQTTAKLGPPYGLIWAHEVPSNKTPYGGTRALKGQIGNLTEAKADGIDGIDYDCFAKPEIMEPTLQAGDQTGILVAPSIDMSILSRKKGDSADELVQAETQTILDYCKLAAGHRSAAKTSDGRYIMFEFGAFQLTPQQHEQALTAARAQGAQFFIIGALGSRNSAALQGENPIDAAAQYADVWDASYAFLPIDPQYKPGIKSMFVRKRKPLIASVMPQYTRAGVKLSLPPDGGARYSQMWQEAIADHAPAVNIITLDDDMDGSNIFPNYEAQTKQFAQQWKAEVLGGG